MIDIHSHIVPGVDDGPSCMEQSVEMVKEAERLGIRVIVATPHYHENIYDAEKVEENYQELIHRISDYDVDIKIGYEVFLNPFTLNTAKSKKKLTLSRTSHILFEFPFNASPALCFEALRRLQLEKIVPIIAHPERNRNFLDNLSGLMMFIKAGCLIQVDAASVAGVYGRRIGDFVKKLIKLNFADMVGSNAHFASDYCDWYMEAYKNVIHWAGQEYAHKLFYENSKNMLDGIKEGAYKAI